MKFLDKVGLTYLTSKLKSYVNTKIEDLKTLLSKDIEKKQDKLTAGENITIDSKNNISAKDTKYTHPESHPASMITEDTKKRFVSDSEKETWNNKLDGTSDITNNTVNILEGVPSMTLKETLVLMSDNFIDLAYIGNVIASLDENAKVPIDQLPDEALKDTTYAAGNNISIDSNNVISATDTKYTHPSSHSANMITENTNKRFVSDAEKETWNKKQDKLTAGANVSITGDTISAIDTKYTAGTNVTITGTTISAKDTIYDDTALKTRITAVENREDKDTTYSAGTNVTIDADNKINAKDTTYTAGTNVTINSSNQISATDTKYNAVTTTTNGLMSSADKVKLNGIETGAQKNNVTSTDIANWNNKVDKVSGKQLSTNDYTTVEKNKLAGIQAGAQKNSVTSVQGRTGAVTITKSDVGLGSVENIGIKILTQSQYDALSSTEKNRSDKLYGTY